ncbi:hypothetical protein [Streptomyces sp. NBC_00069]|uniref:hypothetical protein n=1 Tax=Streptomyces sp. NBC_00069 TaxID=2975639 RepID=UPI00324E26B5
MIRSSPWHPEELAAMSIPALARLRDECEMRLAALDAAISLRSALAPVAEFEELMTGA